MPSRNIIKEYVSESYYHIYNRGVEKRVIFQDQEDYVTFMGLLKRQLGATKTTDRIGREHANYFGLIELLAFCLMPNHFHLFMYQGNDEKAITAFMRSLLTAYTSYFNRRYKRVGGLFQSRFKAVRIINDAYLLHISRYIHLNPENYAEYPYSSYPYYVKGWKANWITPKRLLRLFEDQSYRDFIDDYEEHKTMIQEIKHELADY